MSSITSIADSFVHVCMMLFDHSIFYLNFQGALYQLIEQSVAKGCTVYCDMQCLIYLRRDPLFNGPGGPVGLQLPKVDFSWLKLVGLWLGVTLSMPGSLLVVRAVEMMALSVTLLGPGLVLGVVMVGANLSKVVGDTRPWMVLATRAETVSRLRSGEAGSVCRLAEVLELSKETLELVAARCGFVPFTDTSVGVFMDEVSIPFTVTPAEGEDG